MAVHREANTLLGQNMERDASFKNCWAGQAQEAGMEWLPPILGNAAYPCFSHSLGFSVVADGHMGVCEVASVSEEALSVGVCQHVKVWVGACVYVYMCDCKNVRICYKASEATVKNNFCNESFSCQPAPK